MTARFILSVLIRMKTENRWLKKEINGKPLPDALTGKKEK